MVSHNEVARRWSLGIEAKGDNMFTDGTTIYSFGYHFPIATKVKGITFFNRDCYSSFTTRHQNHVSEYTEGEVIDVTTEQIKDIVRNPEKPIVLIREEIPMDHRKIIEGLRQFCKMKGVKRFPTKKITDDIEKMVFLARI